jgi:hypothetical protein
MFVVFHGGAIGVGARCMLSSEDVGLEVVDMLLFLDFVDGI